MPRRRLHISLRVLLNNRLVGHLRKEPGGAIYFRYDESRLSWSNAIPLSLGMILFAVGHGEALKRFLVEDGAGNDQRFWRLAQALSALYPASTEEKRWVDGVLARKKGLGF